MLNLRAVGNTEANIFNRHEEDAGVPAPGRARRFELAVNVRRLGKGGIRRSRTAHAERRVDVLEGNPRAEADLVRHFPGHARVEVEHHDFGVRTMILVGPVAVVFGRHAEGNREGEAHPGRVVHLVRDVGVRNEFGRLATVFGGAAVVGVVEVETHADEAELSGGARSERHARGVVVDARDVGAVDARTGVGTAEAERGLFGKLEAAGVRRGREKGRNGSRGRSDLEGGVLHDVCSLLRTLRGSRRRVLLCELVCAFLLFFRSATHSGRTLADARRERIPKPGGKV